MKLQDYICCPWSPLIEILWYWSEQFDTGTPPSKALRPTCAIYITTKVRAITSDTQLSEMAYIPSDPRSWFINHDRMPRLQILVFGLALLNFVLAISKMATFPVIPGRRPGRVDVWLIVVVGAYAWYSRYQILDTILTSLGPQNNHIHDLWASLSTWTKATEVPKYQSLYDSQHYWATFLADGFHSCMHGFVKSLYWSFVWSGSCVCSRGSCSCVSTANSKKVMIKCWSCYRCLTSLLAVMSTQKHRAFKRGLDLGQSSLKVW